MNIEKVKIETLRLDPENARKHPEKNLKAITGSLKKFGQQKPIVVGKDGVVIAGNGTLVAAKEMGWTEIDVVRTELTGRDAKAYALADNRTTDTSEWDDGILGQILQDLYEHDYAIEDIGFDPLEYDLVNTGNGGLTDDDAIPDVPQNVYGVERGQIWVLGNHRLMCGDSTSKDDVEKLMQGEKADMVFTDPPYGVGYEGGHFHSGDVNIKRKREKLVADENPDIYTDVIPIMARFCDGPIYTWYAASRGKQLYNAIDEVGEYHAMIVWHKINATYAAMNAQYKQRHEPCVYWKPRGSTLRWCGPTDECTIWEIKRDGRNEFHPTQKPVELAERAIRNHEAKTLLDLFLGSGSTLIACEKTGRKCYGLEIDPHYCSVIIKRWEDFTGGKAEKTTV